MCEWTARWIDEILVIRPSGAGMSGVPHAVVVFGFTDDDQVSVGNPGVGREYWSVQALRDLWHGDYVTLEKDK